MQTTCIHRIDSYRYEMAGVMEAKFKRQSFEFGSGRLLRSTLSQSPLAAVIRISVPGPGRAPKRRDDAEVQD